MTEDKKTALLTRLDEEAYVLLRNLCAPDKPNTKQFKDIIVLMKDHLNPAPSEVIERCGFNQVKQKVSETVSEFAAKLKKMSLHGNYTDLKTALRDQLVCGIRDETTRVELFKTKNLTFDKALEEASARESAAKNAAGSLNTLENKTTREQLFTLNSGYSKPTEKLPSKQIQ